MFSKKGSLISLVFFVIMISCSKQDIIITYPDFENIETKEYYFSHTLIDDYRSLEDLKNTSGINWFESQKDMTDSVLSFIKPNYFYNKMVDYEENQPDFYDSYRITDNGSYYLLKNSDSKSQLFFKENKSSPPSVVFDGSSISKNTVITYYAPSPDGNLVAIAISENSSNNNTIFIYDLKKGSVLSDRLLNSNPDYFGGIKWLPNSSAIIYQQLPHFNTEVVDYGHNSKAMLHIIGDPMENDRDIFSKNSQPVIDIKDEDYPFITTSKTYNSYLFGSLSGSSSYHDTFMASADSLFVNKPLNWEKLFSKNEKIAQFIVERNKI